MRIRREKKRTAFKFISFYIGGEVFGIDVMKVQEVNTMQEVRPIPRAPAFIEGMLDLRGEMIPIIDFRKRFALEESDRDSGTRIIVTEVENNLVGLIVDSVAKILTVEAENLKAAPPMLDYVVDARYISGVVSLEERLLIVIDPEHILSREELLALKQV
ncbi:MAG: purine-binding chemotaxis protein CheW [bacterium]|nr:purine-binding chemotaxis protein CheW [bacterium]